MADLPEQFVPGSDEDFEILCTTRYPRIYRALVAILGDRNAAEDCAQETFLRAYRAWPRWRPEAPVEAWLHQIAVNVAITYRRSRQHREIRGIMDRLTGKHRERDEHLDLVEALSRLPVKDAAAFVLRFYHGYTNREIAVALGVNERTIVARIASARTKVKSMLGDSWRQPIFDTKRVVEK